MSVNVLFVCVLAARSRSELWPLCVCVCVFGTGSLLLLLSRLSTLSWCCHHTASALRLFGTFFVNFISGVWCVAHQCSRGFVFYFGKLLLLQNGLKQQLCEVWILWKRRVLL